MKKRSCLLKYEIIIQLFMYEQEEREFGAII